MLWRGFGGVVGESPKYVNSYSTVGVLVPIDDYLTVTYTESVASTFTVYTSTERSQNAVFSCDVLFSSSPADGQIFKMGGSGTGCWVGLRDGGTVFRVRAGDGISLTGSTNNAAVLDITDFPKDDQVHNVVWEFQPNAGRVRLWIDGIYKGEGFTSNGSSLESGLWAGSNAGNYLATTNDGPTGEPSNVWSAGTSGASVLTFYGNQLASTGSQNSYDYSSGIWNLDSSYLPGLLPELYNPTLTLVNTTTSTLNITPNLGDLVLMYVRNRTTTAPALPSGTIDINSLNDTVNSRSMRICYIIGDGTQKSISFSGTSLAYFIITGAANIIGQNTFNQQSGAVATQTIPALTGLNSQKSLIIGFNQYPFPPYNITSVTSPYSYINDGDVNYIYYYKPSGITSVSSGSFTYSTIPQATKFFIEII